MRLLRKFVAIELLPNRKHAFDNSVLLNAMRIWMSPMAKPAWWVVASCFAAGHFLVLFCANYYCYDQYYGQPCPLDPIVDFLLSPAFFFPLDENTAFLLLPLNSFFWGCLLAEPVRWWFGWPPWRFSLRTLLIILTLIAVLLGATTLMKSNADVTNGPVVQPFAG
jgi:hypothetical protein